MRLFKLGALSYFHLTMVGVVVAVVKPVVRRVCDVRVRIVVVCAPWMIVAVAVSVVRIVTVGGPIVWVSVTLANPLTPTGIVIAAVTLRHNRM